MLAEPSPPVLGFIGMYLMRSVIAFAILVSITSSSWAATVSGLQGQILINTGNGFRVLQGSAQVGVGARVVANQGGQGTVLYDDGCPVTVNPGEVYTIAAVSPCTTGQQGSGPTTNGFAIGAAVGGAAVGGVILLNGLSSASP